MDFSELYKQSSFICRFSPDARYLATAVDHRLVIRDAESLAIRHLFNCSDTLSDIAWSPDSELILCCSFKKGVSQVWSLRDPEWTATIEEGAAGLTAVRWAPDGRHVLTFSDFQLRITIWSLCTKEASYIQYPKYSNKGYSFRKDGRYFVLSERRESRDTLSVYDCEDWTLLKHFPVDTVDLENVAWSPDGRYIAVWDTMLEYKVLIYFPDGRLIKSFSAYDHGLGVKTACWSPSSQFLAIGSYDEKVRLLNHYTWTTLIDFSHPSNLPFPDIPIFKETNIREVRDLTMAKKWAQIADQRPKIAYEEMRPPVTIMSMKADAEKANPKKGVGICDFSCDGRFLVTRNDNMPNTLWIWDLVNLCQVALIQQLQPIKQVKWNPVKPNILVYTNGGSHVYVWGGPGLGCEAIEVPTIDFVVSQLQWSPDGRSVLLMDREKFCLSFLLHDEDEEPPAQNSPEPASPVITQNEDKASSRRLGKAGRVQVDAAMDRDEEAESFVGSPPSRMFGGTRGEGDVRARGAAAVGEDGGEDEERERSRIGGLLGARMPGRRLGDGGKNVQFRLDA
ncbi:WD repeat-containing protein wrap73 [Dinochytrium kinnereticum]|nr:WD repeat-containing protein wrap73 [Dinochytrium kinnereticum]